MEEVTPNQFIGSLCCMVIVLTLAAFAYVSFYKATNSNVQHKPTTGGNEVVRLLGRLLLLATITIISIAAILYFALIAILFLL